MVDSYVQFSKNLHLNNESEREWWDKVLSVELGPDEQGSKEDSKEIQIAKKIMIIDDDDLYTYVGYNFNYEFEDDYVWFYSEEHGEPFEVACLVYEFFKEMRPNGDDEFDLSWSITCGELLEGAFGGGLFIVTKNGVGDCDQYKCSRANIEDPYLRTNKNEVNNDEVL